MPGKCVTVVNGAYREVVCMNTRVGAEGHSLPSEVMECRKDLASLIRRISERIWTLSYCRELCALPTRLTWYCVCF
jgi:hypothetical protein